MITVIQLTQTFSPVETERSVRRTEVDVPDGTTVRGVLEHMMPGFVEFDRPTVVILNGEPKLRADWNAPTIDGDILNVVSMPQGQLLPYLYVILFVASIVVALLMRPSLATNGDAGTVYNVNGKGNKMRLGDPVASNYGRCRVYPAFASEPYNEYLGNEQYLYGLYCIGLGEYDIEQVLIDDTDIGSYHGAEYAVYGPGETVGLFPDNVHTSLEVNNIELLGPNEPGYAISGPFVVNASGTNVTRLAADIVFPGGLYQTNSKGKMKSASVTILFEYQRINSVGEPVDGWTVLANPTYSLCTNTPQRYTISTAVMAGRYQVRARRTSIKPDSLQVSDAVRWEVVRGYGEAVRVYPGVTILAVKVKATYQLNNNSAVAVNVWCTRKLPAYVYDSENDTWVWSDNVATRSPAWAFCDVYRAKYGGQLAGTKLDMVAIAALDAKWAAMGRNFDYTFDQRSTVWEAARVVAESVRSVPIPSGSQISLVEDTPKTIPTAIFGPHTMHPDSFEWNIAMPKDGDFDGVLVKYISPNDFLESTIQCLDGTDVGDNLEEIVRPGVTSRTWAYRDGLYLRRQKKYIRETFTFTTGLEGHLPMYGSLIGLNHDVPNWAQFGLLRSKTELVLLLSEPVAFTAGQTNVIAFRKRDGSVAGPYTVTAGADAYHVVLSSDLPEGTFVLNDNEEPPLFFFGTATNYAKMCIVSNVEPNDDDTVTITCYAYVNVFTGDEDIPDDEPIEDPHSNVPDIPVLDCSSVTLSWVQGRTDLMILAWSPSLGATSFEVQYKVGSADNTWTTTFTTVETSFQFPVEDEVYVSARVRAVGKGAGNWCTVVATPTSPYPPDEPTTDTPGGDFSDIQGDLFLSAPSGGLLWREKDTIATICGFLPRNGVERPVPVRWALLTLGGRIDVHYGSACIYDCDESALTGRAYSEFSGASEYSLACAKTVGGQHTQQTCAGTGTSTVETLGTGWNETGFSVATTETTRTVTATGACYVVEVCSMLCSGSARASGAASEVLSHLISDEEVLNYALAAIEWSAWSDTAGTAVFEDRTTLSFAYAALQGQGAWTNAVPGWTYTIEVPTEIRVYGTEDWSAGATETFSVTALADGTLTLPTFDLVAPRGYERQPTGEVRIIAL